MCFIVKKLERKIAKKNISCYKILEKRNFGNRFLCSPYYNFHWKLGVEESTYLENLDQYDIVFQINEGFHSYITKKKAIDKKTIMLCNDISFVFKAIIPKGAEYYENEFEYVSNKLVIEKEVI